MMDEFKRRLEEWAREDGDFTSAVGWDYKEGFRDAQNVVLGLIQAWTEPELIESEVA